MNQRNTDDNSPSHKVQQFAASLSPKEGRTSSLMWKYYSRFEYVDVDHENRR